MTYKNFANLETGYKDMRYSILKRTKNGDNLILNFILQMTKVRITLNAQEKWLCPSDHAQNTFPKLIMN